MKAALSSIALVCALAGCGGDPETPEQTPEQAAGPSAVGPAAQTSGPIVLTPGFRVGESSVYVHEEISRQAQATSLHGLTREIRELRRFRLETVSVDDAGGAVLRLTMERVASSVVDNGTPVFEFDSLVPADDTSGQAKARRILSGLIANIRVAPGGTVVTMAANLTPADLQGLPRDARVHLAENWFIAAIESLYRPLGERSGVDVSQPWQDSVAPGPPFTGDEHQLVTTAQVTEADDDRVEILAESQLYTSGEPIPEVYRQRARYRWSLTDGRLMSYDQTERVAVEGTMVGVASAEVAEREISFRRINPPLPNVENPPVDTPGR